MPRVSPFFALALLCAALIVGCKKKEDSGGGGPGVRTEDDRKEAVARLKQIGKAMHDFESSTGFFPAGIVGAKGQLGLSWRVAILPYMNEGQLYSEFKLNEPWDSEHNKKLVDKMPKAFESPGKDAGAGRTHLRSFSGPHAFISVTPTGQKTQPFITLWSKQPPGSGARGRALVGVTDGTSNTLMVAEAVEPVEWTRPEDLALLDQPGTGVPQSPVPKLGGVFDGGFHGLFCDGAVRFISDRTSEKNLRAMITATGGEVITE